jgi:hypothetical protein
VVIRSRKSKFLKSEIRLKKFCSSFGKTDNVVTKIRYLFLKAPMKLEII